MEFRFKLTRKRVAFFAAALALVATGAAIGVTSNAYTDAQGVYHGCVNASSGNLRVLASGETCKSSEVAIDWNQVGPQGSQGIQGLKGDKGDQGIQGIQGLKGDQGIQGIQGLKGDKGDKGDQGIQGIQGLKGDTGAQGPQGIPGQDGTAGSSAGFSVSPASVEVTPNNSGSPGSIASLALPAGNYLVFASVVFFNSNNAFAQNNSRYIRCGFGWAGGLGNPTFDLDMAGLSSGWISVA